jgi:hypothetical protein
MLDLLRWFLRAFGTRTLLSLALLSFASGSIVLGLQNLVRGFDAGLALAVVTVALLVGWILARSPLPGWLAWLVFFVVGLELLFWRIGNLGASSTLLANRLVGLSSSALRQPYLFPDVQLTLLAATQLWSDITTLCLRLWDWFQAIARAEPLPDPIASTLMWNMAIWLMGGWSAWAVRRRRQPLEGLLPGIALLASLLAYARDHTWTLVFLVGTGLCLLIVAGYDANERRWTSAATECAEEIPNDLAVIAVPLTCLILMVASLTPSISIPEIVRLVQNRAVIYSDSSSLPESLGLLPQPPARTAFDDLRWPGLPRQHLIGSGPELSRQVVMTIRTGDLYPHMPSDIPVRAYYWRGITYDRYSGYGWSMTSSWTDEHPAGYIELPDGPKGSQSIDEDVEMVGGSGGLVYTAGIPFRLDHDFSIAWRSADDFAAFSVNASSYHVQASVSNVGEEQLLSAGANYPQWVRERYLDLPDDIPQRVLNLARDLTAASRAPYARARAIESYLRTIPYSLNVERPPAARDVVDYFLFDLKKGYCDYFATAMVVLARGAGLPARLVVGYAPGRLDSENGRYVITQADAHSWAEVYFPTFGWIEFEPTSGRPAVAREHETNLSTVKEPAGTFPSASLFQVQKEFLAVLVIPLSILILGLAWMMVDSWRLEHMPPDPALDLIYRRLCRSAARLGVSLRASDTPNEVASLFDEKLCNLFRHRPLPPALIQAPLEFRSLTQFYVKSCYSSHSLSPSDRNQAIRKWKQLHRRLWLAWLASIRERRWRS